MQADSETTLLPFTRFIDPDDDGQQFAPSGILSGDTIIASWIRYEQGVESLIVATFDSTTLEPRDAPVVIASAGSPHRPRMGVIEGSPVVCWISGDVDEKPEATPEHQASSTIGRRIEYSVLEAGRWTTPTVAARGGHILGFDLSYAGSLRLAWCESTNDRTERIHLTTVEKTGSITDSVIADGSGLNRPALTVSDDVTAVAFDRYTEGRFRIEAAIMDRDGTVSGHMIIADDPRVRQLSATAVADGFGTIYAAWLSLTDVIDEHGIVDQRPTIRAAAYSDNQWRPLTDTHGSPDLVDLSWGLLSLEGAAVWGYLGRRRQPILLPREDAPGVKLLWERKHDHDGPTLPTRGELFELDIRVAEPVTNTATRIAAGPRWYEPIRAASASGAEIPFLGRTAPDAPCGRLIIGRTTGREVARPSGCWRNWKPVDVADHMRFPTTGHDTSSRSSRYTTFWADLHVHTGLSADAEGFVDELVYYARDAAHLDVVLLQDNDHYNLTLTDSEFAYLLGRAERFSEDGRFLVIPGFEWTHYEGEARSASHRTVFGKSVSIPLVRNTETDSIPPAELARFARTHDLIVHIHHERFSLLEGDIDRNLEICSGWNCHMSRKADREFYHSLLAAGHRLGFVGGSDNHRRNPGAGGALTGIFAEHLDRRAITAALEAHRCFATNGSRIIPRFEISGAFVGESVELSSAPHPYVSVSNVRADAAVTIYRDGLPIYRHGSKGTEAASGSGAITFDWIDDGCTPGSHVYYLEVIESEPAGDFPSNLAPAIGGMAWTSPIWVSLG